LLKGELNTQMPWLAAYLRSTWLVPMQKQPTTMRFLAAARTRELSLVLERMPRTWMSLLGGVLVWVGSAGKGGVYLTFSISWSSGRLLLIVSTW
jgi:hypothetical protein